jgi:hypothetical protein
MNSAFRATIVCCLSFFLLGSNSTIAGQSDVPPTCESFGGISDATTKRLVEIALTESKAKNISLKEYHSVFAVIDADHRNMKNEVIKKGVNFVVRFSPFRCDDWFTDGGGFDVEIDSKTFEVVKSGISLL